MVWGTYTTFAAAVATRSVAHKASYVIVMQIMTCIISLLGKVQVCDFLLISSKRSSWVISLLKTNTSEEEVVAVIMTDSLTQCQTSEVGR